MCVYVYVHISLFLYECACTTIIDTSLWIFSLMYCCCVSIIIVNCICSHGALIWLINLFLFLFLFLWFVIDRVVMFILDYTRYPYQMMFMWLISNSTGGISGAGYTYPSGAPDEFAVSIFRGYTLCNTQF